MRLADGILPPSAACLVVSLAVTGTAAGQVPKGAKSLTATLIGRVVDTAGAAIAGAEVILTHRGDSVVVTTATSNARGGVTLRDLPAGGPYTALARKVGYGAARGEVQLRDNDTLYVDFELAAVTTLAPIIVKARRNRLSISADQFKPKLYRDALSLIGQKRPDMLGDPTQCALPDSLWGGPQRDGTYRTRLTDRLTLSAGESPFRKKRPWLDNLNSITPPDLPYVQRVYVNGQRADMPRVPGMPAIPGRTPSDELRRIPADQIAEIRYADCWDQSVPVNMQYAIYVVLKPPSREVQDSILRSIMRPAPAKH